MRFQSKYPRLDLRLAAFIAASSICLIWVFFTNNAFFDWAFTRHQNTYSWLMRPILIVPVCWAAWHQSLSGIMLGIFLMLSSMFWFPAPQIPNPEVALFLQSERAILQAGWTLQNISGGLAVLAYGVFILRAFWLRSWRLGSMGLVIGAIAKGMWSIVFSPDAGFAALPYVAVTLLGVAVFAVWRHVASNR
ncbi:hypothetical protein EDD53_0136 [Pacificibacter maritimus]|uniref:Uncharacterized protein n=1 Tax=Pacificibacter maritimus TaxID=762213 RepID=A0A3N4UKQ7_9RHOB|nr:hypothetical protein [Pacificibacter maritimus]RPE71023.1 hypothetical protein EDD53_0136 [Pacificibacter maritimus]